MDRRKKIIWILMAAILVRGSTSGMEALRGGGGKALYFNKLKWGNGKYLPYIRKPGKGL